MLSKTAHAACITRRFAASLLSALILSVTATLADAEDIHVLSGGGPQAALQALIPEFEKATGRPEDAARYSIHRISPSECSGGQPP